MKNHDKISSMLISLFLIMTGIFFIINQFNFYVVIYILILISLFIELFKRLLNKDLTFIIKLISIIILLFFYKSFFSIVFILTGLYFIFTGLIALINYFICRNNILPGAISSLLRFIGDLIIGILLVMQVSKSTFILSLIAGLYFITIGTIDLFSTILKLLPKEKAGKISFPLPTFLTVLLPQQVFMSIPNLIKEKNEDKPILKNNVEVLIHLKNDGPEALGHVDVAVDDYVYSYGLHDPASRKLLGTLGEGVLLKIEKESYIKQTIYQEGKLILGYELKVNDAQKQIIQDKLNTLLEDAYPWQCAAETHNPDNEYFDYASRVYRFTEAKMFKFKKGAFKTYFVATTNCVQLSDYLIRSKELNLINIYGIITPGTYIQFLHHEYRHKQSVSTFNLYSNNLSEDFNIKVFNGLNNHKDYRLITNAKTFDEYDRYSTHVLIYQKNKPISAGRIYQTAEKTILDKIYADNIVHHDIILNYLTVIKYYWQKKG